MGRSSHKDAEIDSFRSYQKQAAPNIARGGGWRDLNLADAGNEPSVGSVGDSYDNLWTPPAQGSF